jgi:hypothetical protein
MIFAKDGMKQGNMLFLMKKPSKKHFKGEYKTLPPRYNRGIVCAVDWSL